MTATPWGFRDILPQEAQLREDIALTVKGCLREHHYLPVETPLLEDKRSLEQAGRMADTPFKLFDDDGGLLVVRPDNTLPIVRLVSARMASGDLPLRLRYEAPVVREQPRLTGISHTSWADLSARAAVKRTIVALRSHCLKALCHRLAHRVRQLNILQRGVSPSNRRRAFLPRLA